jgi:hypothetical protein
MWAGSMCTPWMTWKRRKKINIYILQTLTTIKTICICFEISNNNNSRILSIFRLYGIHKMQKRVPIIMVCLLSITSASRFMIYLSFFFAVFPLTNNWLWEDPREYYHK